VLADVTSPGSESHADPDTKHCSVLEARTPKKQYDQNLYFLLKTLVFHLNTVKECMGSKIQIRQHKAVSFLSHCENAHLAAKESIKNGVVILPLKEKPNPFNKTKALSYTDLIFFFCAGYNPVHTHHDVTIESRPIADRVRHCAYCRALQQGL
jgi:hypothetical protein